VTTAIWVAAYAGLSGIYVAPDELTALRFAVENGCTTVRRIPVDDGVVDLREALS